MIVSLAQRPEVHDTFYACPNQGKMFVSEISIADPPIFLLTKPFLRLSLVSIMPSEKIVTACLLVIGNEIL
jgi:hypothetical protein